MKKDDKEYQERLRKQKKEEQEAAEREKRLEVIAERVCLGLNLLGWFVACLYKGVPFGMTIVFTLFGGICSAILCLLIYVTVCDVLNGNFNDNNSGSSGGWIDGPRMVRWYTRGYVRRSMRRLLR